MNQFLTFRIKYLPAIFAITYLQPDVHSSNFLLVGGLAGKNPARSA
ncbi:hypothetical protein XBJ1_2381 [Xenorhabdus bovienii SS-2004]|uniref:Uncharacterized protein n=2 Tax=Xenorhabdus bovienii TaxID=40576 RepID=D3V1G3_XENBS|nr:hypothetical protein XBJ1_2381 [Xenorhabdus bovienii SS-2004]CDH04461.1 hypothetical protein XBO1_1300035 [Xenorhabdus bovienii str. oregonense]